MQSPALRSYVATCAPTSRRTARIFHDDTGDPALTLDMYEDGDHLARAARAGRYTEMLFDPACVQRCSVIFHSLDFVVFFLVFTAIYWRLPHRGQNLLLLAAATSSTATSIRGS